MHHPGTDRPSPALGLLAGALAAALAACATTPPAAERGPVRVLVYNIHAGKDAAGADNLARVAELVRATGADIALLQEVDRLTSRSGGVDQPAELARRTGLHAAFGRTLDYQGGEYGIAILSRWPIAGNALLPLPIAPPQQRAGGSYEPRGALVAAIARAPGDTLRVIDTHLDASADDRYRVQEASRLRAIADSVRRLGGALLVGGDFNATPESAVQRSLHAAGWRDAWPACGEGAGEGFTFPAARPVKRIDYLFLFEGARCRSARVLDSEASDHRALLVEVVPGGGER
jgi:endonuclease/exonuclease/phosphatase family metal-dependent hydrolase